MMNNDCHSGSGACTQPELASVRSLSEVELLDVWERGQNQPLIERALTMLVGACRGAPRETLAAMSIGQRDSCLLTLRESLFGPWLSSVADCPACGERLEMTFGLSEIRAPANPGAAHACSLHRSGYEMGLRPPNSLDLLAVSECENQSEIPGRILERCVLRVLDQGETESIEGLLARMPAEIIEAAIELVAQLDPQADVQVNLICPSCRHTWHVIFDIVSYLWSELHERAAELLREVNLLASAFGWRESDILNMSSWRRQCYAEMLIG